MVALVILDTGRWWRLALPVLGISLLLLIGLYWDTAVSIVEIWWRSDTYAHGVLVIPIVLYMVWVRRYRLAYLEPSSEWLGLGLLLLLGCSWLVAYAAGVQVVQQFALVGMMPVLVFTLLGRQVTWELAFPLAYLFFMVPVGDALLLPLQNFTAWFTVKALRLTGIPVFWEGLFITIPTGSFKVAEACSGLRYLIASVAIGCLYAYLSYHSLWRRLLFIALAIVVPIIANGVRAYGIVMLAYLSNMRLAVGVDHLIYGWLFFGLVILLLFWVGSFWREPVDEMSSVHVNSSEPVVSYVSTNSVLIVATASILVIASGPLGTAWLNASDGTGSLALVPPAALVPWSGPESNDDNWKPDFKGAEAVLHQIYRLEGQPVHLYIAYYRQQQQGAELINSKNKLYDGEIWSYRSTRSRTVPLADDELQLKETHIGSGLRRRLLWHWYWVTGYTTNSALVVKLLEAWDRLSGDRQGSAVLVVTADYELRADQAEILLKRFLNAMKPAIEATLEGED